MLLDENVVARCLLSGICPTHSFMLACFLVICIDIRRSFIPGFDRLRGDIYPIPSPCKATEIGCPADPCVTKESLGSHLSTSISEASHGSFTSCQCRKVKLRLKPHEMTC